MDTITEARRREINEEYREEIIASLAEAFALEAVFADIRSDYSFDSIAQLLEDTRAVQTLPEIGLKTRATFAHYYTYELRSALLDLRDSYLQFAAELKFQGYGETR